MIISHRYKFIFIKTMKTAGSSIEVYLHPFLGEKDIATRLVAQSDQEEKYALVQNCELHLPIWKKLWLKRSNSGRFLLRKHQVNKKQYSEHMPAWMLKEVLPQKIWKHYYKFCVVRNPYDRAISHYYFRKKRKHLNLNFDQYLAGSSHGRNSRIYLAPNTKNILVDQVLKYEELDTELGRVFKKLGVPYTGRLTKYKKSNYREDRRPYKEFLTPEQAAAIRRIHAVEFELFDYTF